MWSKTDFSQLAKLLKPQFRFWERLQDLARRKKHFSVILSSKHMSYSKNNKYSLLTGVNVFSIDCLWLIVSSP